MTAKNTPAFPVPEYMQHNGLTIGQQEGMTQRTYIATAVLPAILTEIYSRASAVELTVQEVAARIAVEQADALLAELNK